MIDFLRGLAVQCEEDYVVLDVNGVGYRVFCANPYAVQRKAGEPVTLYIHYHVREDAHLLFGFQTREEQGLFRKLLEVTGIGPRVALGVLSGGAPETVAAAIQREDVAYLTRLPGIGKKTAQRLILDLKDKLPASGIGRQPAAESAAGLAASGGLGTAWGEAKDALLALGLTEAEIAGVFPLAKDQLGENATAEQWIKSALKLLSTR